MKILEISALASPDIKVVRYARFRDARIGIAALGRYTRPAPPVFWALSVKK